MATGAMEATADLIGVGGPESVSGPAFALLH